MRRKVGEAPTPGGIRHAQSAGVNGTLAIIRYLWPYLRPDRRRLAAAVGVAMALIVLDVASPLLLGLIVSALIGEGKPPAWRGPGVLLTALAVAAVLRGWLTVQQRRLGTRLGQYAAARIREKLWRHVLRLPVTYTRERGAGRLLLRFIADARTIQRLVTGGLLRLGQELLLGAAVLIAMLALNWRMALPIVAAVPAYALLMRWLNPELRRQSRASRRRRSRLSSYFAERVEGILIIKSSVREQSERRRGKTLTRAVASRATSLAGVQGRIEGLGAAALGLATAGMLAVALREVEAGRGGGGVLVAFIALLGLLAPVFTRVIAANRTLQETRVSLHRLEQTLARPAEVAPDHPRHSLRIDEAHLQLEGVSYSHYPEGRPILDELHLDVRPGRLIAIAGANGSGKSTLLLLLLGLLRPTGGRVLIDDQDLADVSAASLRSAVGFVPQEAVVFDGTVEEAVAYGLPPERDAAERHAALERAAELAGLEDLLAELPGGWQAKVGLGGRRLSGGQRQRLCLARALAADPQVLLLDEPTSALDPRGEEAFAARLQELAITRLVIVIAHRTATLAAASDVFELRNGRLAQVVLPKLRVLRG